MFKADSERSYRRIATEEAFAPVHMIVRYRAPLTDGNSNDRGFCVPDEVAVTDSLPIGADDKRALYETNAQRVSGLA